MTKLSVLFLLAASLWPARWLAAAEAVELVAEKWQLNRVRKSAHEQRDHFYDGNLALRNRGKEKLVGVCAQVSILDAYGNIIKSSERIEFGDLAPGQSQERRFVILRAVVGAEVLVKVVYRQSGVEKTAEFSSSRGGPPVSLASDSEGNIAELRLLGYDFAQPGIGKGRSSEGVLVIRVRNLAPAPARNPTARLEFLLASGGAAKAKTGKKSSGDDNAATAKNLKVIEVLLDDKEIPPGATRVFEKKIKGVPEYAGMNIVLRAEWPAVVDDNKEKTPVVCEGEGDKIKVESLKIESAADGSSTIRIAIANSGEALPAHKLKITISFLNDKNEAVAKLAHVCAEEFPTGQTVAVVIVGQKIPPHASYDVMFEF